MAILNTVSLQSNKKIKINFDGGNLSSDGGLLLIKKFTSRIGLIKLINRLFKTNDHSTARKAPRENQVDYAVEYGEFMYQTGSWSHSRRVVISINISGMDSKLNLAR